MRIKEMDQKLTLVGAGPGDPDLITLKGIKALKEANIVLYDALVNPILLKHCRKNIPKIYAGKRAGKHSISQENTNQLIVESVFNYGYVVRLKGGDPYIFGRGHEEILHAESFGIKTEVVPGLSSISAVPTYSGIPLTHRGLSESFWVITGTTKHGTLSKDVYLAAQSTATIIILMGIKKLEEIIACFKALKKSKSPVAIIMNGTMPDQKAVVGTIETIAYQARTEKVNSPAIIIIGDVVSKYKDTEGFMWDMRDLIDKSTWCSNET